jgi:hypothetical protein
LRRRHVNMRLARSSFFATSALMVPCILGDFGGDPAWVHHGGGGVDCRARAQIDDHFVAVPGGRSAAERSPVEDVASARSSVRQGEPDAGWMCDLGSRADRATDRDKE